MSKNSSSTRNGISTISLLGIAFIVLKLTNVIDWNWWWVLAPFWIGIVIAILLIVLVVMLKG